MMQVQSIHEIAGVALLHHRLDVKTLPEKEYVDDI
jgi:hypothetical protein